MFLDELAELWTGRLSLLADRAFTRLQLDAMRDAFGCPEVSRGHLVMSFHLSEDFLAIRFVLNVGKVDHPAPIFGIFG